MITTILIVFHLLSIICKSLGEPSIIKSLPGYPGHLPFNLETGYIGFGEEEEVQLFYYFAESERDVERDPLMLWLTGGPGCSAFSGLVFEIGNENGFRPKLNVKGYVLGNPTTNNDQSKNSKYKYLHRISLVSDELYKSAMISCKRDFVNVDIHNTECLNKLQAMENDVNSVAYPHVLEHGCVEYSSPKHIDHIAPEFCREQHYPFASAWANDERVREALHIDKGSKEHWVRCNRSIAYHYDLYGNSFDYHLNLSKSSKSLQVLIYSGDQDRTIPYVATLEWIKLLNIPIINEWRSWFVDGQVAGYSTEFKRLSYRLVYTTIKGGGHTAPEYKPRECLAMIDRWLSFTPL